MIDLTESGRQLVSEVNEIRRHEIRSIVQSMSTEQQSVLVAALSAFGAAAGEVPTPAWWIGNQQ